jgi:signal transduction histidine kinase
VLYRAARELLINVTKHSEAQRAGVGLERQDHNIRICVADDGKGFDASLAGDGFSATGGFGLFNIREYLRHAGGTLQIKSAPGQGTEVVLTVPLKPEQA